MLVAHSIPGMVANHTCNSQQHNMWTLMGRMPMPQILDSHHHLLHTGQTIGNNNASSKDATHLVK